MTQVALLWYDNWFDVYIHVWDLRD